MNEIQQIKARYAIVVLAIAELFGASLWFSINAISDTLRSNFGITTVDIGHLTSAVQLGFIVGSLFLALSDLADRFSASHIFVMSAIVGALANLAFVGMASNLTGALFVRFTTGFTLAGIYPIGMKLVMSWAPNKAGHALGWLIGTLALGTGLPHFIRGVGVMLAWQDVMYIASILAVTAAIMVWWLGDGPHHGNKPSHKLGGVLHAFRISEFRTAAFGYFGHMWELYAFWALVPYLIAQKTNETNWQNIHLATFGIFVAGSIGCITGGILSHRWGSSKIAIVALSGSGLLCFIYPWVQTMPYPFVLSLLLVWGYFVAADSPQFSALAAKACASDRVGGTLALMNSIGFAISIFSIELASVLWKTALEHITWLLLPGPVLGLIAMRRMWRTEY